MDEVILHPFDDAIEDTLGLIESVLDALLASKLARELDEGQRSLVSEAQKKLHQVTVEFT